MRQWLRLFRFRSMWGLTLGAFCTGYAVWMYQTWLPAYLEMQQHISIKNTGYLASIPLVCSIIGAVSGGWVCDRMAARGIELVASRRIPAIVGLVLSGVFTYAATAAGSATLAVILISAAMYFLAFGIAGKWTMITAVAPQSYCTSVASLQNFGGYLGGTASPLDHRVCGGRDRLLHRRAGDRRGDHGDQRGAAALSGQNTDRRGGTGGRSGSGGGGNRTPGRASRASNARSGRGRGLFSPLMHRPHCRGVAPVVFVSPRGTPRIAGRSGRRPLDAVPDPERGWRRFAAATIRPFRV